MQIVEVTGSYVCLKCFSVLQLFHTLRRTALQTESKLQDYEDAHPERRTFSIADVLRNEKVRREEAALEKAHSAAIGYRNEKVRHEEAALEKAPSEAVECKNEKVKCHEVDVAKESEEVKCKEAETLDETLNESIVIDSSDEEALDVIIDFSSGEEEAEGDGPKFEVFLDMEAESEENFVVKEENEIKIETKTSDSCDEHSN